jgi:eukaryotic-like serine/threonine-protein kinase
MSLTSGTKLGPYEILSAIGAGGMGEVYRARDTKLNRDVAIKVLPTSLTADSERLARFQREAQVLAALNHPHIAAIHHVEEAGDTPALVMELVEGETLAERIARGPIPVDEAMPIARQIAEALEAAHEQGIIHRDLKPANIKVRHDGTVKVLDFGLAKLTESSIASPANPSAASLSPTITSPALMTGLGTLLGTAAYMAPEQAKGRPADKRSDIWAFGAVLYEMLTGRRAFGGEDVSDTLAHVLMKKPDWTALPADTPAPVRTLLRRCLEKDRRRRIESASDARLEIDDALTAPADEVTSEGLRRAPPRSPTLARLPWALAAVLLVALVALLATGGLPGSRSLVQGNPHAYRSAILPPTDLSGLPGTRLALSPDGAKLAFVAPGPKGRVMLWVRPLEGEAQPLAGTEDAGAPFWSPDGRFLAFIADGKLKKIDAAGGLALTLCDALSVAPGTWNRDDVILFTPTNTSPLYRVSAAGGTPAPINVLDTKVGETRQLWPVFLPDGRHFLYSSLGGGGRELGVYVGILGSADRTQLLKNSSNAAYGNGQLLFLNGSTLVTQPFDATRLSLSGAPVPIAQPIETTANAHGGTFAVSQTGVLAYQTLPSPDSQLIWYDRAGKQLAVVGERASTDGPLMLSPDGRSALINGGENHDTWVVDVKSGLRRRFTFGPTENAYAIWSPDGGRIVFGSSRKGHIDLYQKAANGAGDEELLLADTLDKFQTSWSRDGRFILYTAVSGTTSADLWVLPLFGDRKPYQVVRTPFSENQGKFSPDGRWIAYSSNESGRVEVYVTPFPGPAGKQQISTNGGDHPQWRHDGKEIFFMNGNALIATPVTADGARFDVGVAQQLFDLRPAGIGSPYDVSPDGQRILVNTAEQTGPLPITLVVNWPALLKP